METHIWDHHQPFPGYPAQKAPLSQREGYWGWPSPHVNEFVPVLWGCVRAGLEGRLHFISKWADNRTSLQEFPAQGNKAAQPTSHHLESNEQTRCATQVVICKSGPITKANRKSQAAEWNWSVLAFSKITGSAI